MDERELVGLLYRADWTRLALTGTVRGSGQFPPTNQGDRMWSFRSGPPKEESFPWPVGATVAADSSGAQSPLTRAPGKRYRLAEEDGSRVLGCDGERVWQWLADIPAGEWPTFERKPQPPVAGLLAPAWLLMASRLSVEEETTVAGRAGIVVSGTARSVSRKRGLVTSMVLPWELIPRPERVSVVVDRELGILLRRELSYPDGTVRVTEFLELEVGGAVDPSVFSPVAGSFFGGRPGAEDGSGRSPLEDLGVEALKLVGGLAAGGLGAAIKYSPKRQVDPFAAATTEDPDDAMPEDEPLPAWAGGSAAGDSAAEAGDSGAGAAEAEGRTPVGDEVL